MPRISKIKEEKIQESILGILFQESPNAIFTYDVAKELARDEEYTKKLLESMESKKLITGIRKNPRGIEYSRRIRWQMHPEVYNSYKSVYESKSNLMKEMNNFENRKRVA